MKFYRIVLGVISLFTLSCTQKDFERIEKGEYYIINNYGIQKNRSIELKEHFSIDLNDNSNSLANCFSPVSKTIDKNGNLYIVDRKSSTVKKFDSDGNFIHSFGGRGNGPGEFISYGGRFNTGSLEDTLFIYNDATMQYLKFDTDGNFLDFLKIKGGLSWITNLVSINENQLLAKTSTIFFSDDNKKATNRERMVKINSKLELVSDYQNIFYDESIKIESRKKVFFNKPNDQRIIYSKSRNGFLLSYFDDKRYQFEEYNLSGERVRTITKKYIPLLFEDKNDRIKYEFGDRWEERKYKRAILGLYSDKEGNVWVATPKGSKDGDQKGVKFDIFVEGVYKYSTFLDLKVESENLVNNDNIYFHNDRIYLFNFDEGFVKSYSYNLEEE